MNLRPATPADHGRIVAIQPSWWGGRDLTDLIQPLFLENFASTSLVVDDEAGELAAFLIGFASADDPTAAYVHFLGVDPNARGQGLGRRLHESFAEMMAARGVTTVRCITSTVNSESIAFHQHIGFEIESIDESSVHFVRHLAGVRFAPRIDPRPDDPAWPKATWPIPPGTVLRGAHVSLSRASEADAFALFRALDDSAVWTHVRGRPETAEQLALALSAAPETGRYPWIVRIGSQVVGTTSYLEVSPIDARLEIGYTVYAREVWGGVVNPECKLLLMTWAFENGFGRVQLKTDIRNVRSQQAIARLGATYEGVLRRYQRRQDESIRDTVVFSVTAEQWPDVRAGLETRLS